MATKHLKELPAVVFIILLLLFITKLSFSQEKKDELVYQLKNENLQTISDNYFQYLEGVSHTIPFTELKSGNWTNSMKTTQSFKNLFTILSQQ